MCYTWAITIFDAVANTQGPLSMLVHWLSVVGKEMGEEVIYILSKSSFSIFSPCYCLESTALSYGSLACVSLVPFQKNEKKIWEFFVVKMFLKVVTLVPSFLLMKPQTH